MKLKDLMAVCDEVIVFNTTSYGPYFVKPGGEYADRKGVEFLSDFIGNFDVEKFEVWEDVLWESVIYVMMKIDQFDGEYAFLSNFYPCDVEYEGITYGSSEAAYQAAKFDKKDRKRFIGLGPGKAKKLGRTANLPKDWNEVRITVMRDVLRAKFLGNKELAQKLVEMTGESTLIEGNWWNDRFWGVDSKTGVGENHLGKLLMELRDELRGIDFQ